MPSTEEQPTQSVVAKKTWYKNIQLNFAQLSLLLSAAFMIFANPFSLKDNADLIDANIFNFLAAPSYGTPLSDRLINKGQNAIVVVLFDEAYLAANNVGWPLEPSVYAELIRKLASAGSIGIYIDIRFQGGNDTRNAAIGELFQIESQLPDTPVVFGGNLSTPKPSFDNKPPPKHTALLEMPGGRHVYLFNQYFEEVAGKEYLHRQSPDDRKHGDTSVNTAAYEMFKVWCARYRETEEGKDVCELANNEAPEDQMFLQWGYAPDKEMYDYYYRTGQPCQQPGTSWWVRMRNTAEVMGKRLLLQEPGKGNQAACMYHRNFSALFIERLGAQPDLELLREIVEGRVVFIGANVRQSPDQTYSPVQLYVPGVFRHAMALDNLIEQGDRYLRWDERDGLKYREVILFAFVLLSYVLFQHFLAALPEGKARKQAETLYGCSLFLFLLIVCAYSIYAARLGPNSWVSYLLMFVAVEYPAFTVFWALVFGFWATRPMLSGGTMIRSAAVFLVSFLSLVMLAVLILLLLVNYLSVALKASPGTYLLTTLPLVMGLCAVLYLLVTKLKTGREVV